MNFTSRRIEGGVRVSKTERWAKVLREHSELLPVAPEKIPTSALPHPRVLTAEIPLRDAAYAVAVAFTSTTLAFFQSKPRVLTGGREAFELSKHYMPCAVAAQEFVEREWAPVAWCAFSMVRWKNANHARPGGPPLAWTFGAGRIKERAAWYLDEKAIWDGGSLCVSTLRVEYQQAYQRMQDAILSARTQDAGTVSSSVLAGWPGGLIEARRAALQVEIRERNEAQAAAMKAARFEWIG